MKTFSALSRRGLLDRLGSQTYDVLVIGGGITGAGIALDAVSRGLKVALVEKKDFAWGTSSRSTKLVHGGLRYLKQMEFALVKEVGLERAIVHNNARHVVRPERMIIPIVKGGSLGKFTTSLALQVYDYLAKVPKGERRKMLSKDDALQAEPLLDDSTLKGAGLYFEYRTDDARLTIENIKTAFKQGANCLNYLEATEFILGDDGQVCGARLQDHISGRELAVKAKVIVNAAGPWVDALRLFGKGEVTGKRLHLTKGVHLVVPKEKLPIRQAMYFDVQEDSRMVFAIPRDNVTYIGTTDTNYKGDTGRPIVESEDVEYVLKAVNDMFPDIHLATNDVISTWAGLRPLIHQDGKKPSELSRKDEIFHAKNGLISIAGGKLTGYRKMAERTVDQVVKRLQQTNPSDYNNLKPCHTDTISLSGNFKSEREMERFIIEYQGACRQIHLSPKEVLDLIHKYGKETEVIIERAFAIYPHFQDPKRRIQEAELWYAVNHEMSHTLCDYIVRRTGRLYFERPSLVNEYEYLGDRMAKMLEWDDIKRDGYIQELQNEIQEVVSFKGKDNISSVA